MNYDMYKNQRKLTEKQHYYSSINVITITISNLVTTIIPFITFTITITISIRNTYIISELQ